MNEPTSALKSLPPLSEEASEVVALATEMESAYHQMMREYTTQWNLSLAEAHQKVAGKLSAETCQRILSAPPEKANWASLRQLAQADPALMTARWEVIKQAALEEVQSGHRAAKTLEHDVFTTPWQRAQFLALRTELSRNWTPQNGIEQTLIDQMALAYHYVLYWMNRLNLYTEGLCLPDKEEDRRSWRSPRMEEGQVVEMATGMLDRFQRMFLRTQRALRDMRRYTPPVIVQQAGQVNVGGQQINVAEIKPERERPE